MAQVSFGATRKGPQKYDCGIHDLTYTAYRAGCPACEAERDAQQLRHALKEATGKLEIVMNENHKLRVLTDIVSAIREAALVLEDEDLAFLKTTLYEWRDKKSLALKTTHGARKKKREVPAPNGFIVMPRSGDPYGHLCSSIGGLAIAEYFDEATNTFGPAKAMEILVRGMSAYLPGAAQ
jgi:hypothetical protein